MLAKLLTLQFYLFLSQNTASCRRVLFCNATMLPQNACNLIAALSATHQKDEPDWDLHITTGWERRIPFCSYVSLRTTKISMQKPGSSFSQFSKLPSELQIHTLSFCAASTLFQAMQASPVIRKEASKLFWANPNAYFPVPAYWLLEGGYPGFAWWDSNFQDCVRNVEIEFHSDPTVISVHSLMGK